MAKKADSCLQTKAFAMLLAKEMSRRQNLKVDRVLCDIPNLMTTFSMMMIGWHGDLLMELLNLFLSKKL